MVPHPTLLVHAIRARAKEAPDSPWLLCANPTNWKENGYNSITWKKFFSAISKSAFWLDEHVPRKTAGRQTFAYRGPNDARYYILMVAAAISERTMFIPDGRITPDGLSKILNEINCTAWITTREQFSPVKGQETYTFPSLEEMISQDEDDTRQYVYDETWEQAKDDIVCIIHTSGTTGLPKPIYLRNGWMSVLDWTPAMSRYHPRNLTYRHMVNTVSLTACPPQWAAGFAFSLNAAAFVGLTTVMLPPDVTVNPQLIIQICKHTGARSLITPPSLIEELVRDQDGMEFVKGLKYILWVGAGLNQSVGDALAPFTRLVPAIGSTERGLQISFESDDISMWNSFEFVPETGPRFEPVGDNLYELHIDRNPESDLFQGIFYTFPNLNTVTTSELYSSVIDKNGSKRWVFQGRKDDLVKLAWLAKFHATHIENTIARHDKVKSAIVGGEGHDVPYIIIEPKDRSAMNDSEGLIDEIYELAIRNINKNDDDAIQIPREVVMLTDPALPFKRTLKMTIMRKEVEKSYQGRINDMYKRWESKKIGS